MAKKWPPVVEIMIIQYSDTKLRLFRQLNPKYIYISRNSQYHKVCVINVLEHRTYHKW